MQTHARFVPPAPLPRSGFWGLLDRVVGPGETTSELILQFLPPVGAAVAAPLYASTLPIGWSGWQLGLISILGFDLVGGILTPIPGLEWFLPLFFSSSWSATC